MKKKAFVIDSTLATTLEDMESNDIYVQPLHVIFNEQPLRDLYDIRTEDFYQKLKDGLQATTSQPAAGEFLATFEKLKNMGYDEVFVFTISQTFSGTYQSAVAAGELIEGLNVYVIDSVSTTSIVLEVVYETRNFARTTDDVDAILAFAQKRLEAIEIYLYVHSLDALKKGGRLNAAQAIIGNMLQIKPILGVIQGEITVLAKERTLKKGFKKLVSYIDPNRLAKVKILHTHHKELAETLKNELQEVYPDILFEEGILCPVIGVHTGEEACGIALIYND